MVMASVMSFRKMAFSEEGSRGIACINSVRYRLMVVPSGALVIGIVASAGAARVLVQRRRRSAGGRL